MALKVGIVGLANVGKSTLFNALVEQEQAEVGNYPFTTIDPNTAVVEVPDRTLDRLKEFLGVSQKIPATIEFVDIAGLIKGAHKGEGLGNQFLDHIRRMNALIIVLRAFESKEISFSAGGPKEQLEIVLGELWQKDRETLTRKIEELRPKVKADKKWEKFVEVLEDFIQAIDQKKDPKFLYKKLDKEEKKFIRSLFLLSLKPYFLVVNVSENEASEQSEKFGFKKAVVVSAKTEKELIELDPKDQKEYLEVLGLNERVLKRIIKKAYSLLDLITFYTYKPKEMVQAWALKRGSSIIKAAGKIHSDFAKNFIKAEVINTKELLQYSSLKEAGEKGKIKIKGRDYKVKDKDLIYIHHS